MRFLSAIASCLALASATILQNGQPRANPYPGQPTLIEAAPADWISFPANASQLSYKGRWDSKYISWWSAPGLKFGFTGDSVAVTFGEYTSDEVLLAWRLDGQDWQFANVTANATYQFVTSSTTGFNLTTPAGAVQTFEFRVTNWALGVQVDQIWLSNNGKLHKIPSSPLQIEIIGDSLSAGQYATYEGISSYSWGLGEGFGYEFQITAYPGICLHDQKCYGNLRGQTYQWLHTSDTSYRAIQIWGDNPEPWQFDKHQKSDIVVINLGTNDASSANGPVSNANFTSSYIELINEVHNKYPKAQVICLSLWEGFGASGNTFTQGGAFIPQIQSIVSHFETDANTNFVHYFNTTGILQHNDIGPQYHPTDVGHIKLASHLKQYIQDTFGWAFGATGPEVQSGTLYWNDQQDY